MKTFTLYFSAIILLTLSLSGCLETERANSVTGGLLTNKILNLKAINLVDKISLDWEAINVANSYTVYWGTESGVTANNAIGKRTNITASAVDLTTAIDKINSSKIYFLRVSFVRNNIESELSNEISVSFIDFSNMTILAEGSSEQVGKVSLTWSSYSIEDAIYKVYWSKTDGDASSIIASGKSTNITTNSIDLTIDDLGGSGTHYFVITYTVNKDKTLISNKIAITPKTITIKDISNSTIGKVQLSWDAVKNATAYNVYWGHFGGFNTSNATGSKTNISATNIELSLGELGSKEPCYFFITYKTAGDITSANGVEGASKVIKAIDSLTADTTAANLIGGVTLDWDDVVGVDSNNGYKIYWGNTIGHYIGNKRVTDSTVKLTVPDITLGSANYFVVTYFTNGVESTASEVVSAIPTKLILTVNNSGSVGGTSLTWSDASRYIEEYTLVWTDGTNPSKNATTNTNNKILITNADNAFVAKTQYTFTIGANTDGNGIVVISDTTVPVTDTPDELVLTATTNSDKVALSWNTSPFAGRTNGYIVYWNTDGSNNKPFNKSKVIAVTNNSVDLVSSDISVNTFYYFTVAIQGNDGTISAYSNSTRAAISTDKVTNLKALSLSGTIRLTWDAVADNSYTVYWGNTAGTTDNNGDGKPTGTSGDQTGIQLTTNNYIDFNTTSSLYLPGVDYYFIVTRTPTGGSESFISSQVSTAAGLIEPTNITVTPYANAVLIEWKAVDDADGYNLYYATSSYNPTPKYFDKTHGTMINDVIFVSPGRTTGKIEYKLNLSPNIKYYFILTATKGNGESSPSIEFSETVEGEIFCNDENGEYVEGCFSQTIDGFHRGCNYLQ